MIKKYKIKNKNNNRIITQSSGLSQWQLPPMQEKFSSKSHGNFPNFAKWSLSLISLQYSALFTQKDLILPIDAIINIKNDKIEIT